MKFTVVYKKIPEEHRKLIEKLPGAPRPKFFSPHFPAIYYPNASCYLSVWVVMICSGYPHCAPLERRDWTHRHTIDISLRWSEKLNKSTITTNRKRHHQFITVQAVYGENRMHGLGGGHRHEDSISINCAYYWLWCITKNPISKILLWDGYNHF